MTEWRYRRRHWLVVALLWAAITVASSTTEQSVALNDLLTSVGRYVVGFQRDFTMVISDETYRQKDRLVRRVGGRDRTTTTNRTIRSETFFLWIPEQREWLTVRNVLKVDGKSALDSRARIYAMLRDTTPGAAQRFRRLRDESARYNIGNIRRNMGDPALALQFIDPGHQPRFEFALDGAETVGTISAWKLRFVERAAPTMITVDGHDALASGAIWVTASGIVLRTRLELDDASSRIKVTTIVTYGRDRKLAGWFPMRMDETYVKGFGPPTATAQADLLPARPSFVTPFSEQISCVATYSNYRRFETSARIVGP